MRSFTEDDTLQRRSGEEKEMATSSIFANFEIKDHNAAKIFVDALCSDKHWPQPNPDVKGYFLTNPKEIQSFFAGKTLKQAMSKSR